MLKIGYVKTGRLFDMKRSLKLVNRCMSHHIKNFLQVISKFSIIFSISILNAPPLIHWGREILCQYPWWNIGVLELRFQCDKVKYWRDFFLLNTQVFFPRIVPLWMLPWIYYSHNILEQPLSCKSHYINGQCVMPTLLYLLLLEWFSFCHPVLLLFCTRSHIQGGAKESPVGC